MATISALSAAFVGDDGRTFRDGDEAYLSELDAELSAELDAPPPPSADLRLFERSQPLAQLSPEQMVRSDASAAARLPPLVALYHGEDDPTVPVSSTKRFEAAVREADFGGRRPDVLAEYPGCSHLDYILDLVTLEAEPPLIGFLRRVKEASR